MKKLFKMIMVLLLAVTCLMQSIIVNAAGNGKITITKAEIGKTYSIYKLFDLESYNSETGAYTYTIDTTSKWYDFVLNGAGKDYITLTDYTETKKIVSWNTNKNTESDHAEFAKLALKYAKDSNPVIAATDTKTAETTTVEFTGLDLGYYLIDSSLGALCGLTTTKPSASVVEKNSVPTIDKEVKEDSTGEFGKENSAQIGDTVEFKTTITIGKGAINYTLYDKMSAGLTYKGIDKVTVIKAGETTETTVANTNYTVKIDVTGYTFVIAFDNNYLNTLNSGDKLVVYYTATLNTDAIVAGEGNPNETILKYGDSTNHTTEPSTTTTYTYEFDVVKTKSNSELLDGAEFKLYTSNDSTTPLKFTVINGVYKVDLNGETDTIVVKNGKVTIEGLDLGTYYLEETKNPAGYNKLTSRVSFTVTKDGNRTATIENDIYKSGGIQIKNYTGTELPSTGGMGTVLFIVIGTLMVLGFGVLLVTKLRISKMSI